MLIKNCFELTEIQTLLIIMGETTLFYQLVEKRVGFAVCPGNSTIQCIKNTWKLVSNVTFIQLYSTQYAIYLIQIDKHF